jgi:hypothetical protein
MPMNSDHDNASELERSRADSAVLQLRTINEIGLGGFSGSYEDRVSDSDRDSNMEKYYDLVRLLSPQTISPLPLALRVRVVRLLHCCQLGIGFELLEFTANQPRCSSGSG